MPVITCSRCGGAFELVRAVSSIHKYTQESGCDHLLEVCPFCGLIIRIFLSEEEVDYLFRHGWKIDFNKLAHPHIREEARIAVGLPPHPELDPDEPPHEWLVQIFDDLRHFEGKCDGQCGYLAG